MARTNATNFTQAGLQFPYANAATDPFRKEDVQVLAVAVDQHDHASTRGLAVARVAAGSVDATALADGAVTSAKILDGTIATIDIAANAITQRAFAAGATSGPTTTSTTFVDLPDMTVTLTTNGGDLVAVLVLDSYNSNAGVFNSIGLSLDAAAEVGVVLATCPGVSFDFVMTTLHYWTGVSAASHTIKGRWRTQSNTATAFGTNRRLFVMELKR
jgi:hypothetical protein